MLVAQTALNEVEQWAVTATKEHGWQEVGAGPALNEASPGQGRQEPLPAVLLLQLLAGHPDHHAVGKGRLEAVPGELADHLIDSQAVVFTHVVQEPQSMVLEDRGPWQSTGV